MNTLAKMLAAFFGHRYFNQEKLASEGFAKCSHFTRDGAEPTFTVRLMLIGG